jgi:hypothetical protein
MSVRRAVLTALASAAFGFVLWFFGLDLWYAIGAALAAAAVGVLWLALPQRGAPDWPEHPAERAPGVRDDVVRLAWSLRMHKGSVHEPAYKRLRAVATERLARAGLTIDDDDAVRRLLGPRAASALHPREGRLPSFGAVVHCLDALDDLDRTTAAGSGPLVNRHPAETK